MCSWLVVWGQMSKMNLGILNLEPVFLTLHTPRQSHGKTRSMKQK